MSKHSISRFSSPAWDRVVWGLTQYRLPSSPELYQSPGIGDCRLSIRQHRKFVHRVGSSSVHSLASNCLTPPEVETEQARQLGPGNWHNIVSTLLGFSPCGKSFTTILHNKSRKYASEFDDWTTSRGS